MRIKTGIYSIKCGILIEMQHPGALPSRPRPRIFKKRSRESRGCLDGRVRSMWHASPMPLCQGKEGHAHENPASTVRVQGRAPYVHELF